MKRPETKPRLKGACRGLCGLALVLTAGSATAQEPIDTTVVPWSKLTEKPLLLDSLGVPGVAYPALLRSANIAGEVRLTFVVGPDGRPIVSSSLPFRVESSSHELFTNSVMRAASEWRFTPPVVDGRPVRAEIPVTVQFAQPVDLDLPLREISQLSMDSAGVHAVAGWEQIPRERTTPRDSADVKWAKLIVLLRLLSMNPNADSLATTCVRWSDKPNHALPPAMMSRIRAQYSDVVNADACPRTYFSPVQIVDSLGRPARRARAPRGHVDPVWVAVGDVQPWTADLYVMQGYIAPAGGSHNYRCQAERDERGRWSGTCELRSSTMY